MDGVKRLTPGRSVRIAGWVAIAALLVAAWESGVHDGRPNHITADGTGPTLISETEDTSGEAGAWESPTTVTLSDKSPTITTPTATTVGMPRDHGRVIVPSLYEATVVAYVDLQTGIDMLDPGDREVFDYRPGIPDDLPATAYRSTIFGRGEYADPPRRPTELVVATQWPRAVRANVLCLLDAAQVPCSSRAGVWRVEFDEPAMAFLELPKPDGRRDIIFVEERDGRPEGVVPVSHTRGIDGWDVPLPVNGSPPPVINNPLGGCDWVLFIDNLEPRDRFVPIRTRPASGPVYMVISVCDDHPTSYEMAPLLVVNETTVAQVDGFHTFVARPGATYAWKLPDTLLNAANNIRGAAVRRAPNRRGVWVTHPLVTTRHP